MTNVNVWIDLKDGLEQNLSKKSLTRFVVPGVLEMWSEKGTIFGETYLNHYQSRSVDPQHTCGYATS